VSELGRYRELATRLNEERASLERLRADYAAITRSRFHALRMLWFSLKQLLGRSSEQDVYAAWSANFTPTLGGQSLATATTGSASLPDAERVLVHAWNQRVATRSMSEEPLVTLIIAAFNHRDVTVRCLRAIAESWFESLDVQFIVVDDFSTDGTAEVITQLDGVEYVRSPRNEGFVRACNRGARLARGKYLCFLNNDTVVRDGWLDYLVTTADGDDTIGVVGAKLVYPDGRLQEAGSILWRDATGWNVGRFESPDDPRYNYVRDTDYVSGAALLVRRDLFERLRGFGERFRPAYYEDADLCFGARELGYRVVYQPRSVVIHEEGLTSGDERVGVKRFQEINRPKFREKWAARLEGQLENHHTNVAAASRTSSRRRTVLVIDSYVPLYDKESGSQRMFHLIKMLRRSGYAVTFLPDNYAPLQPYTSELQQMGVEVLHHFDGGRTLQESLDMVLGSIDFAWISRPDLYEKYATLLRRNPKIRLVYDTVDLAHVRGRRKAELLGESNVEWQELQRIESSAAKSADATVVVTNEEKRVLEELGARNVFVVPNVHELRIAGQRSFAETSGLIFIGNYNHPPNVDAVCWLCEHIMPLVWKSLPNVNLTLIGSNPSQKVSALAGERVRVTGYVRDVSSYFRGARIFVAPLRFGAGMKGKIGQALEFALPVVTTVVGAEGMDLRDGDNAVIAPPQLEEFAAAVVALYGDAERWTRISSAAGEVLRPFSPQAVQPQLESVFDHLSALQPA
jgi:O-antigen biosynthesis protein